MIEKEKTLKHYKFQINFIDQMKLYEGWILLLFISSLISSCSVSKNYPEGRYLSTESQIIFENSENNIADESLKIQLQSVLKPKPNKAFLGTYPGLYFYYKNKQGPLGFINRFIYKKIGEEPAYYSEVTRNEVEELLHNRLDNNGFFYSRIESKIELDEKKKEAKGIYTIKLEAPYLLNSLKLDSLPSPLNEAIIKVMDKTLLLSGQRFELNRLKAERERIELALKKDGYYNFNGSFIVFEVDTNQYNDKRFDLFLKLKNGVPQPSIIPYTIAEIKVFPSPKMEKDSLSQDTITLKAIDFIGLENVFRPDRLAPFITLRQGKRYNGILSKSTSRRLSTIGMYRFVNIQHSIIGGDSLAMVGKLKTTIELSPFNKRAIRAELQALSKSNNFAGPALALTYTNRNLFRGGETLKMSSNVGYEFQVGNQANLNYNLNFGLSSELIFPRLILPFKFNVDVFKYDIPKTRAKLSIEHSNRSGFYKLISGTVTFGYDWNAAPYVTHNLNPVSINYNNLYESSAEFLAILADNASLEQSFDQQFIAGMNYSFLYNELINAKKKAVIYFNGNIDMAGNSLGLISKLGNGGGSSSVLGIDYAQYAKIDLDLRLHYRLRKEKTIVIRFFGGYGTAYGNSTVVPFVKQFYSGGPYSLRAFNIRSIGPGIYETASINSGFFEQTGNIKLEANVEFRFPIYSYLKGAIFTDVGNIWLSKANGSQVGGEFGKDFLNQLGMGAGMGLRVDVQGFVVRFDFSAPFHTPIASLINKYAFDLKETKFNFAIGYPF